MYEKELHRARGLHSLNVAFTF